MKKPNYSQENFEESNKENSYKGNNNYKFKEQLARQYGYHSNQPEHNTFKNQEKLKYCYDSNQSQQKQNRPYRVQANQRQPGHLMEKRHKKIDKHENQFNQYHQQRQSYNYTDKNKNSNADLDKDRIIHNLKQELSSTQNKLNQFKQKTITQQIQVLNQLEALQGKFATLKQEKDHLQKMLQAQTKKANRTSLYSQEIITQPEDLTFVQESQNRDNSDFWKQKYEQLLFQHKKIKGIGTALVDMMTKVQGKSGQKIFKGIQIEEKEQFKDAWRWIKNVVRQYETIRQKALEWKQVYDKYKHME